MRDPNRLFMFYDTLRDIHMTYLPDWRFGQFIMNFFGWLYTEKKIDGFYPEDDRMLELLEEYAKTENTFEVNH